jgi:type 1 glutamine amidotransferase
MKSFFLGALVVSICFLITLRTYAQRDVNWKNVKVLLYTKNGKGYVHDNIPSAIQAIQKLGKEKGFAVTATEDPAVFTEENLKQFTMLLFANTNNDVFDNKEQRLAFRRYIESGGGFVGLHSVLGTERNWTWFKMLLGGSFLWHPKFQQLALTVIDPSHPSMQGTPASWTKSDECYFMKEMYPGIKVVMAHDLKSLNKEEEEKVKTSAGSFGNYYPAVWYQQYDGGTIWVTTLGHDKTDYEDATYLHHILRGMEFVASQSGKRDFKTAYAVDVDEQLRMK